MNYSTKQIVTITSFDATMENASQTTSFATIMKTAQKGRMSIPLFVHATKKRNSRVKMGHSVSIFMPNVISIMIVKMGAMNMILSVLKYEINQRITKKKELFFTLSHFEAVLCGADDIGS